MKYLDDLTDIPILFGMSVTSAALPKTVLYVQPCTK